VINVANIPGKVQIGASPAQCNSLTIGGGNTAQTLTVQGALTIGAGGAKLLANGRSVLFLIVSLFLSLLLLLYCKKASGLSPRSLLIEYR